MERLNSVLLAVIAIACSVIAYRVDTAARIINQTGLPTAISMNADKQAARAKAEYMRVMAERGGNEGHTSKNTR